MKYVVVMTHTQIENDSRIQRQIRVLQKTYRVLLCCQMNLEATDPDLQQLECITYEPNTTYIGQQLMKLYLFDGEAHNQLQALFPDWHMNALRAYETYRADFANLYRKVYHQIKKEEINVAAIIANDVFVLPMAYRLFLSVKKENPNVKLLGDMHEVHFNYSAHKEEFSQLLRTWLCDTYVPKCQLVSSVSEQGVGLYKERYPKLHCVAVRNVAEYHELSISVQASNTRLVHVGSAQKARELEHMITCMKMLDETFTLDFYLVANNDVNRAYVMELKNYVEMEQMTKRIQFHEPVPPSRLIEEIHQYDIGIFYLNPTVENHKYALPNKLFEYIQARLAVVTTPLSSMSDIIQEYQVGATSKNYELVEFAQAISSVSSNLAYYKEQSNKAAKILNTDTDWSEVVNFIKE